MHYRGWFECLKRCHEGCKYAKILNSPVFGMGRLFRTSTLASYEARNPVLNKNSDHQSLQSGVGFGCLNQNRNIQISAVSFPRRNKDTNNEDPVDNPNNDASVPYEELASKLRKCSSVQEQMEDLGKILMLTPEDQNIREQLCLQVKEMLSLFFKDIEVGMYGSTANGFGMKGSDIDMCLKIPGEIRRPVSSIFYDIPSPYDILNGKVSIDYVTELPRMEQLLFILDIFREYYKDSIKSSIFIDSLVPIVRFHHDKYQVKCDLTISESNSFRNTKLLKLCKMLDERVTPLMMTIRYWAKHLELIGGKKFNSYTISLLVLYFLQTRKPPVLPTVEYLMSFPGYLHNVDVNDESYVELIEKIPPSQNKQTAVELLRDFFFFYVFYDFNQVIRPLTASSVPRTELHAMIKNFKLNTICVQDPIKLYHNVAMYAPYPTCRAFSMELLRAVKLLYEENTYMPSSSDWGILSLLNKPDDYADVLSNCSHILSFQIPSSPISPMEKESRTSNFPDDDAKHAWFQKASHIVLNVLEHALLLDCKVQQNSGRPSQYRSSHGLLKGDEHPTVIVKGERQTLTAGDCNHALKTLGSATSSSIQLKDLSLHQEPSFTINCVASQNTWLGRVDLETENCLSSVHGILEAEHAVSLKLIERREKNLKTESFSFACECYELDFGKQISLLLKFKPSQGTKFNPVIGLFLRDYVPRTVDKILKCADVEDSRQQNAINSV